MPLPPYLPCLKQDLNARSAIITQYFNQGFSNEEILSFLSMYHGISISLSTLKRLLSRLGLRRRISRDLENEDEIRALLDLMKFKIGLLIFGLKM